MDSFFVVLVPMLAAGIMFAGVTVVQRIAVQGKKKSFLLFLAGSQVAVVSLFLGIYLTRWGFSMPPNLKQGFWSAVCVGTLANYGIQYCNAKAKTYDAGEVSLTAPLSAMTPGLITLLAIVLGEFPGPRGCVGVACMAIGSWFLLSPKECTRWWEYFTPFRHIKLALRYRTLDEKDKERVLVVWLVLGSAMLATVGLLASGLYARRGGDTQGWWLAAIVLWSVLGAGYFLQYALQDAGAQKAAREEWTLSGDWKKFWLYAVVYASLVVGVTVIEYSMYSITYVAYVGTLKRLSILFAVLAGAFIFREQDIKKRALAAAIIVAGALLIGSEGLPERLTDRLQFF